VSSLNEELYNLDHERNEYGDNVDLRDEIKVTKVSGHE
jgi:hypothetical protein